MTILIEVIILLIIKMAFLRITTPHGHIMAEVYSCFQKYVRRGDFQSALYWGAQIAVEDQTIGYKGYPNALKKRLMQHALEDIGHIEFSLKLLQAKISKWEDLIPWIHIACNLPKTRAAAWINRLAVECVGNPEKAPTPVLKQCAQVLVLHRDERKEDLVTMFTKQEMRLYKEINDEVLVFHTRILINAGLIKPVPLPMPTSLRISREWITIPQEVPEWALDKHTSRGKRMGRGYEHFFETMELHPKLFPMGDLFEAEAKALYLNGSEQRVRHILAKSNNLTSPTSPSSSSTSTVLPTPPTPLPTPKLASKMYSNTAPPPGYTNILQAQLVTGFNKCRVWYATMSSDRSDDTCKQVVIKGPMSKQEQYACMKTQGFKERLGIPHANMRINGEYLIQDCLVDYTLFARRTVSSKIEQNVTVPETSAQFRWKSEYYSNNELSYALLEALLFRKMVGTNDTVKRNIIVNGSTLYTIDDPHLRCKTPYMWKTVAPKDDLPHLKRSLDLHWDRLVETIKKWKKILRDEDVFELSMLDEYSNKENWKWI